MTLAKRPGTIALVNWRVANRWADGDGRSATVNAQIDGMANSIKALGTTKIMLTVHHEPENDISPGGDPELPDHDLQRHLRRGRPTTSACGTTCVRGSTRSASPTSSG